MKSRVVACLLEECWLASPLTVAIVRFTQAWAREHGWVAHHPSRHDGVARFLTVRHLPHTASCAVHLIAVSESLPGLEAWARGVAALSPEVRTVTVGLQRGRANVPVVISAERKVPYEDVVKVMDRLQKAGVQRVGLSVKQGG